MNVLLIGGSNSLLNQMIKKLNKEGHRVSLLTGSRFRREKYERHFERYDFTYDALNLPEVFSSVSPDVTVFLGAFDSSFRWANDQNESVRFISGLMNLLTAFSGLRRGRFLYLSSEQVFNGAQTEPYAAGDNGDAVDYRGLAVAQGEELCESFRLNRKLDVVTVRLGGYYYVPHSLGQVDNVPARMCFEALTERRIHALPNYTLSFLYESDAVQFLSQLIAAPEHAHSRYQLSSGRVMTQEALAELVSAAMTRAEQAHPGAEARKDIEVVTERSASPGCCALDNAEFREEFGVNRVRELESSIDEMAAYMLQHEAVFRQDLDEHIPWYKRLGKRLGALGRALLPFIENLVCFIPFFLLNNRAAASRYFSGVEFYLLYVLLFAAIHGQQQAALSAVLATAGYLYCQMTGSSPYEVMVDYNTYIWIAQVFIIGMVVGYMKDRLHLQRSEAREESSFLAEQIDDIKEINSSNVRVKDAMQTQIINQSDSIGKIYEITSTLNQYSYEEVLFYATEILSRVMDSRDIAIYTVDNGAYARMFTATSDAARALGNSVKYTELEAIYADLSNHRVFINKELDPQLPMMVSALYDNDDIRLILMIWCLPWEKMTLGQANLLAVSGALIQNAALRANRYLEALRAERFVGDTPILNTKEFAALVQAYINASGRGLTVYSLLALDVRAPDTSIPSAPAPEEEKTDEGKKKKDKDKKKKDKDKKKEKDAPAQAEAAQSALPRSDAAKLDRQIRPHDYLGEGSDGMLYALLTNTDAKGAAFVIDRLARSGVASHLVERLP